MTTLEPAARVAAPVAAPAEPFPWRPVTAILVALILLAGAYFGPLLVERPFLASLIEARLCPELHIECRVAGTIRLRVLPYPVIEAKSLTLSLPGRKLVLSADEAAAELRALPLLAGRVSVNHLSLTQARIEIAAPVGGTRLFASAEGAGTALIDAIIAADRLGDRLTRISLADSRVLLRSESGKHDVAMEAVTGVAVWPRGGGDLLANFSGFIAGEAAGLHLEGPDITDLTRTEGSPLSVRLGFGGNWLAYRGRLVRAPDLVAAGTLEAMLPSAKRFVRPLHGMKWPSWLPDTALHIASQAFVTARGVDFENGEFIIGRSRFSGGMSLRMTADGRPSISGTLATPLVEIPDPSLLRPEEVALPSFGRLPDLDLRMSARRVVTGGRSIDAVAAGLILAEKRLDLTLTQSSADDMGARVHLVANPDEEGVAVKLQASSDKLDVASLLRTFSVEPGLSGTGGFSVSLDGRGGDLARLEQSLSGKASLQMQRGELAIASAAGQPAMSAEGAVPGEAEPISRRFAEASFAGIAERGVLALTDGRIGEGASRIRVSGKLDLVQRSADLSLAPASEPPSDPPWRLHVTGPWSAPKVWRDQPAK